MLVCHSVARAVSLDVAVLRTQGYLSTIEHGQREIGAEVLLAISREFDKSIEWLLTGED